MGVSSGHQHLEFNVLLTELQPGSREGYVTPKTGRVIPQGDGKPWVVNRFHQKVMQTPLPPRDTWDITGYGQQAGGTYPTGMLSC